MKGAEETALMFKTKHEQLQEVLATMGTNSRRGSEHFSENNNDFQALRDGPDELEILEG